MLPQKCLPKNQGIDFTEEEKQILQEYNRKSFLYGCIPWMTAGVVSYSILVKRGFWKPSWLKVTGVIGAGFVVGKVTWAPVVKKAMLEKVPDGALARLYREKEARLAGKSVDSPFDQESQSGQTASASGTAGDYSSSINFDVNKDVKGLDDSNRPNVDFNDLKQGAAVGEDSAAKRWTSYDEIRQKHRQGYQNPSKSDSSRPETSPLSAEKKPGFFTDQSDKKRNVRKNQYGDEVLED